MKQLLLLFLIINLITSCNNNGPNPFINQSNTAKNNDKEGAKSEKDDNDKNNLKADDNTRNDNRSNWTQDDRNKWLTKCGNVVNSSQSANICSCILEKLERKYPNARDAELATEEEGKELMKECSGVNNGEKRNDENDYTKNNADDNYGGDNSQAWTKLQREQYVQGCESVARSRQPNYTVQQVHSYCDCMTSKVELKYNFQQAMRMTAADFQTVEWQNAAAACMPKY